MSMLGMLGAALDSAPSSGVADSFLQYGVLGAVALVLGWFAWSTIKRERDRADALEARLQALHESVQTQVVPTVTRASEALARVAELLPDLMHAAQRRS